MILERQRGITIQTAVTSFCWNDYKINIVDTPGHMDFSGEVIGALRASEAALLVIDATSGIEVGTERAWKFRQLSL